jgi:hypothetical protein
MTHAFALPRDNRPDCHATSRKPEDCGKKLLRFGKKEKVFSRGRASQA